ncbi:CRISPR-associated protein [Candidatus Methanophagaceae archaeon]|nr:CRISPR-associated protein [Methanophagales archaeon]
MIKMKKAMIISVGGTPEPIIKSITTYRPDIVHFMPSQSSITQIGEITAKTGISPVQIKTKILDDHQSLVSAFKTASEIIKELKADYEIWIDYTGGTKSMSAGLVAAGLNEGCKFVYVGAVDEDGFGKKLRIFLAHAKEDKEQVYKLYLKLKEAGFEPWLDEKELLPGQVWRDEIQKAIQNSDFIIACLSKISVAKKGYVQKEYRTALDLYAERPPDDIYLIPVRLDDCKVPNLKVGTATLRDFQWVDLFIEPDGFEKILKSIKLKSSVNL